MVLYQRENWAKNIKVKERRKMPRRVRRILDSCYLHIITQGLNKEYI